MVRALVWGSQRPLDVSRLGAPPEWYLGDLPTIGIPGPNLTSIRNTNAKVRTTPAMVPQIARDRKADVRGLGSRVRYWARTRGRAIGGLVTLIPKK